MPNTNEQRIDIIMNCDLLLSIFEKFEQTDLTPEGRLKAQLNWLKERAINNDLPLPVNPDYLSTLRYIYTDGTLNFHASSPDKASEEIEVPMERIIALAKNGNFLYKKEYKECAIKTIELLIEVLEKSPRTLSSSEKSSINEIKSIKSDLTNDVITPPLGNCIKKYPNYYKVDTYNPSISDLNNGRVLIKTISNMIFNGIRPDLWVTPQDAEIEIEKLRVYDSKKL
jgi:chaperonin cofactor prefoldin